ncbi:MAG: THUMP-like domain-containing protein [Flavobacterium sp.]
MFEAYLTTEVQVYIAEKSTEPIEKVAFQKNPFPALDKVFLMQQIVGKQKAQHKLPTWYETPNIIFPTKVSIEQTSSEITAEYKASLIENGSLCDLSGGFGADSYYFSKRCKQVVHCEWQPELSVIVAHNSKVLGAANIICKSGNSLDVLSQYEHFDYLYVDPARRSTSQEKIVLLEDCEPNVVELQDFYFSKTNQLLIKTSPLLDIVAGLQVLKNVSEIHIVAVQNEVKELLWLLKKGLQGEVKIITKNLKKEATETFTFDFGFKNEAIAYSLPKKYLYEPNAAVMKSGGFDALTTQFSLMKLNSHSHLFTSDELFSFCGRIFEIEKMFVYHKKEMILWVENQKMNVTTRNFPETVAQIRKKWKIKDGGEIYSFFTTNADGEKIVLLCKKITN